MKYVINGGHELSGKVRISGNKNSVFPCFAAALLTSNEVTLENISNLKDTQVLIQIMQSLGVDVKKDGSTVIIKADKLNKYVLPEDLMMKLRGSIVLAGAVLGRLGRVTFCHPGGDVIGRRSIDVHISGFKALGCKVKTDSLYYLQFDREKRDVEVFLQEASVTATENLILSSVLGKRITILKNCAKEPHVVDLCRMLTLMGAKISGIGRDIITISGVNTLSGCRFRIGADYVEIGTYMVAAAITGGRVEITGLDQTDIEPVLGPLASFGIKIERKRDKLIVWSSKLHSPQRLSTNIWPGFPTDLMSVAIVLSTQSKGVILCHDWMYDGRMFFTDKLLTMGAKITLADPHRVLVEGPTKLQGRKLASPDIRAGMALVMAALVAKGKSIVNQAELIERGYEDVVGKLRSLGADIERVEV
jgi:UDP-N-acetylglucosamine 1-carboxyvinyltransferase